MGRIFPKGGFLVWKLMRAVSLFSSLPLFGCLSCKLHAK